MNNVLRLLCCLLLTFQAGTAAPPQDSTTMSKTPPQDSTTPPKTTPQDTPTTPKTAQQDPATAVKTPVAACEQPCLEDGTPVTLVLSQTVSSADARVGDRVQFGVAGDVKVSGIVVIPKDGIAWGTVTQAQPKRRLARGGKLEIVMDTVRLTDGEKVALRATKQGRGGDHKGAMAIGIVATGLVFFPVAPLFLLIHGKDITFPQGAEVPTFIDGNFRLDLSKFSQTPPAAPASTPAQTAPTQE